MANFKTHIAASTIAGMAYGGAGVWLLDAPPDCAAVAAGLCALSGMLPDLDSDSGTPLRETIAFSAAVAPLLMLHRLQRLGLSTESIVLAGALVYLVIRFVVAEMFRRYTVHRGMWHSIPAALSIALVAFLLVESDDLTLRLFKAGGALLGFLSHLVLDEWYSIEWRLGVLPRPKRSFGTALKLWSRDPWANLSTYGKLAVLLGLAAGDPLLMQRFSYEPPAAARTARQLVHDAVDQGGRLLR